jgi:tetratricopeptide (TPR) repeat protein
MTRAALLAAVALSAAMIVLWQQTAVALGDKVEAGQCAIANSGSASGNSVICNFNMPPERLKELVEAAAKGGEAPLLDRLVLVSKTLGVTQGAAKTMLKIVGEDPNVPDDKLAEVLTKVASDYKSLKSLQAQVAAVNPDDATARKLVAEIGASLSTGNAAGAGTQLDELIKRQESALNRLRTELTNSYASRAMAFRILHQYSEAEKLYPKIFATEEETLEPNNPKQATRLNNLGELFLGEGSFDKAEAPLKRSIEIYETLNQDDTNLIVPLSNLGQLYWATFRYSEAESAYKRAIKVGEKASLGNRSDLVTTRLNYAQLLDKVGRTEEAVKQRGLAAQPAR